MSDDVVGPGELPTPGAVGGTGPDQSSGGPHLPNTPLAGLTVLDLSTTMAGAFAAQFLADAGADVIQVERPGGTPLRALAGWPSFGRGKRSVVLDLTSQAGSAALDNLVRGADVLLTTFSPATAERLGVTPERSAAVNPRLVSASITGWGSTGPWKDLPGYEALVMAKLGYYHNKRHLTNRPGPAFISVPYASWGAGHTAAQGILAALLERESSGLGQHVQADLVRGVGSLDCYNWFLELVGQRWPDAYEIVDAFDNQGRPLGQLVFPLLIGPTKDGHWLGFAQVQARLFRAFLAELGLLEMMAEPRWRAFPDLPPEQLDELWDIMLNRLGDRTLAEWEDVFVTSPDISAELFRSGPGTLEHPQLLHDGRVVVAEDPELGPVRQLSTLVHAAGRPLVPARPAPRLDEHGEVLRAATAPAADPGAGAGEAATTGLPLAGVTVLEFAKMYAAPYGTTLLTDLGARVIKIEEPAGDAIRYLVPFPEAAGAKVLQGKESIALDLGTAEGRQIVHELAARADLVLQSFRAGAAERIGVDEATLKAINPDLVYLHAPGYGLDGPYADRPAYAPSICAAAGQAALDVRGGAVPQPDRAAVKNAAFRLLMASNPSAQPDGVAALGVGTALLLGLLAHRRGRRLRGMTTTMLATVNHQLTTWNTDYAGKSAAPTADDDSLGYGALYRMYRAADGWVFLAAPAAREWAALTVALAPYLSLADDDRFATPEARTANDAELTEALAAVFAGRDKDAWEGELTRAGVGCVAVAEIAPELTLMSDESFAAGYSVTAMSPIFDEHRRLAPVNQFSRSTTKADGGCLVGEHTDAILRELGYDEDRIEDLRKRQVVV